MKHRDNPYRPETAAEALARWDAGEMVGTVEMGGLGPGYEQCIHIIAFELIRALLAADWHTPEPYPKDKAEQAKIRAAWDAICDSVLVRLDGGGYSGAQVGAAQNLAAIVLQQGWRVGLDQAGEDRQIMVSRTLPQAPPAPSSPEGT